MRFTTWASTGMAFVQMAFIEHVERFRSKRMKKRRMNSLLAVHSTSQRLQMADRMPHVRKKSQFVKALCPVATLTIIKP